MVYPPHPWPPPPRKGVAYQAGELDDFCPTCQTCRGPCRLYVQRPWERGSLATLWAWLTG